MNRIAMCIAVSCIAITATNQTQAQSCNSEEHRQFDFWLGEWEVRTPDGKLAGQNRISSTQNGCVLHEQYSTPGKFEGQSLNSFDTGRQLWHQTWVDNTGTLLLLEGKFTGTQMVLQGEISSRDGSITHHRIQWTPNKDGSVRQHWQSRTGNGEWSDLFDGLYTKKAVTNANQ